MSLERVQITNYERWGNLIKTWATGKDYVADGNRYPVPKTLNEFNEQLQRAQVGASIPDGVRGVQFIQMNDETLLIRLPPKEGVEQAGSRADVRRDLRPAALLQAGFRRRGPGHPGS